MLANLARLEENPIDPSYLPRIEVEAEIIWDNDTQANIRHFHLVETVFLPEEEN